MEEIILHNPKVQDLIEALAKLDPNKKIIICDPDTGWDVDILHIDEYKSQYEIGGDYSEMNTYRVEDTP